MDPLRRDAIERARTTPPSLKLAQALEMMATGIKMKRAQLARRFPEESTEQIEARLQRWLDRDE